MSIAAPVPAVAITSSQLDLHKAVLKAGSNLTGLDFQDVLVVAGAASVAKKQLHVLKGWLARALTHLQLGATSSRTPCL